MNVVKLLKKLKAVEPDREYVKRSRHLLLGDYQSRIARPATVWQFISQNLQAGSTIALAGIVVVLIAGGLSTSVFSPLRLSSLDPISLRAEADAIDIQIQLTDIAYTAPQGNETTLPTAVAPMKRAALNGPAKKAAQDLGLPAGTATSSMTIDEALLELSK